MLQKIITMFILLLSVQSIDAATSFRDDEENREPLSVQTSPIPVIVEELDNIPLATPLPTESSHVVTVTTGTRRSLAKRILLPAACVAAGVTAGLLYYYRNQLFDPETLQFPDISKTCMDFLSHGSGYSPDVLEVERGGIAGCYTQYYFEKNDILAENLKRATCCEVMKGTFPTIDPWRLAKDGAWWTCITLAQGIFGCNA